MITFPVEGLDLSKFVLTGDQSIYDLYAVSNHYGGLKGGHYTAFARNPVVGKWHQFDDSKVQEIIANDTVTKAAYVLFYKRR